MRSSFIKTIIMIGAIGIFAACEDSPFLTKQEAETIVDQLNTSRDPFHAVENVVAIINNDIYYFNTLDGKPRQLTDTPDAVKTEVKLSFDHSQIAYLNANGNPVIIQADNGEHITTLTQYSFIQQMDWAKDQLTLYMLIDNEIEVYGTALEVIQPTLLHPFDDVESFSMNSIGDQGYFIAHYGDPFPLKLNLYSEVAEIDEEYSGVDGKFYDFIDFYDNNGNFLLGYKDSFDNSLERIICVQNYGLFPAYEWDYEKMNTPQFNAEHEILIYGTMESSNNHVIIAYYLGE
ncbi:unnamed protein product, partial [Phaeothamnion confervicola]